MKIRRSIFWFTVIATLLIALVLWCGKKKTTQTPLADLVETNNMLQAIPSQSPPTSAPAHTNVPPIQAAVNAAAASNPDKGEQIKEGLAVLNDVPIAFYGKLEDQFGSPVVSAQVAASIRIYNGVQSTVQRFSVTSDANGFFQIKAGKGESLGVVPSKEGYVLATTSTYFKYSYMYPDHFTPDQGNPTVIKMWKLQGAEPLVGIDQHYKFHYTNGPIYFDLIAGKIVPSGGDLKIKVNRPDGIISQQHPQNWSIQFEVIDGGFSVTSGKDSAITFAAPAEGYQPSDTFGNDNGSDMTHRVFFVQSRNGQVYTKLGLSFRINNSPDDFMYITLGGVANTNGSRNWEATASH